MMELSGSIYRLNSNGPRTEPCGTPQQVLKLPDLKLPRDTVNILSVRLEESQLMTRPDKSTEFSNLLSKMS